MVHISEREEQLPNQAMEELVEIMSRHKDMISLGPGEPDFDLPKPLIAQIKKVASMVNHYTPAGGLDELKEAIVKKLRKENKIRATKENVVVTCGSQEALLIASAVTLDVSEQVLLPNPSYMSFLPTIELFNASPKFFELKEEHDFEPNPQEIKKSIDPKKTKVLILNSPANPTGNVIRKKVMEEIADLAIEYDLMVFSDEAYERITYDGVKHVSMASLNGMENNVCTFQSFSKTFAMCGFRLGYVVAPKEIALAIKKTHLFTTICAPTISQQIGIAALNLPKKYTQAMVKEYDRRRKIIVPRLNEMGLHTPNPKGAFYTFSNIRHLKKSSKQFAFELLKKQRVGVVPGSDFGSAGEGFIRCSFGTKLEKIETALDRMDKFVENL